MAAEWSAGVAVIVAGRVRWAAALLVPDTQLAVRISVEVAMVIQLCQSPGIFVQK
jgi:hypothetical protein